MRSVTKMYIVAVAMCLATPAFSHGFHDYRHVAPRGYHEHGHGGNWLIYGLGAAMATEAVINAARPYNPPVVYSNPYPNPGYHYVQVPVYCYPQGVNVQPYVCGYQLRMVQDEN